MAIAAGINLTITAITKLSQVSDEVAQKASKLGEEFSSTKSEISDYKQQVEDLYKTINDSGSSIEEVADARKNLLSIQDELIEKFGTEKESIELVTEAINGQTGAWDELTAKQWKLKEDEFNKNDIWGKIKNKLDNYSNNIDRMESEYGDYTVRIDLGSITNSDELDKLKNTFQSLGLDITDNEDLDWSFVKVNGTATEVYNTLLDIQTAADDLDLGDKFNNQLTELANNAKDVSDQYEEMWNNYILQDKIFDNEDYTKSFKAIQDAYEDYQKAKETGDSEQINQAIRNYKSAFDKAMAESNGDEWVNDYFSNMYPTIQSEIDKWRFDFNINGKVTVQDSDGNDTTIPDMMSNIAEAFNGMSAEEIEAGDVSGNWTDSQVKAYVDLEAMAKEYGYDIDDIIEKMRELGYYIPTIVDEETLSRFNKIVGSKNSGSLNSYYTSASAEDQAYMQTDEFAKILSKNIASEQKKAQEALENSDYDIYKTYWKDVAEAQERGLADTDWKFGDTLAEIQIGNIDTANRKALEWTSENIAKYGQALASYYENGWGQEYANVDDYVNSYLGSISTVDSMSEEFDGVEISFTPMLVTEDGVEYLDYNTVHNYINGLIEEANKQGLDWKTDPSVLLGLDTTDYDNDGIFGLLFGQDTDAYSSHLAGELGAVAQDTQAVQEAADAAGMSCSQWFDQMEKLGNSDAVENGIRKSIAQLKNDAIQLSSTFSEALTPVQQLSDGLDQLDEIYADIIDGSDFDFSNILDNDKFTEAFGNLENATYDYKNAYEDFIKAVTESPDDINGCQEAFNNLASAYIYNSDALQGVTDATAGSTAAMLKQMGVENAEEVVSYALTQNKLEAMSATYDLATATEVENYALINEAAQLGVTSEQLFYYQLQKALSNDNTLDTSEDCAQLLTLAQNAGVTGDIIEDLTRLMQINQQIESGTLGPAYLNKLLDEADSLTASIKSQATQFKTSTAPVVKYGDGVKTLAAKQKKAEDATKAANEALKEQKEALEKDKEALEDLKDDMDDLSDAIAWFFDKKIDAIDKSIEAIEDENDELEKQQDIYDSILAAIDDVFDKRIDELEAQKDALEDNTDELEKQKELEEARIALEEARNRKSLQLYQAGKGFTYSVNTTEIKEAEQNLADIEAEIEKDAAEKAIDDEIDRLQALKDQFDAVADAYTNAMNRAAALDYFGADWDTSILYADQSVIDQMTSEYSGIQSKTKSNEDRITALEKEKEAIQELADSWADAVNEYKYAQYEMQLNSYFGSDYEYQLLNNSATWRAKFVAEYSDLCAQIEDLEKQIKALDAETSSSTASSAESASDSLSKTASAFKNLTDTAEQGGHLSEYVWDDDDDSALAAAQHELDNINTQLRYQYTPALGDAKKGLEDFIQNYEGLKTSKELTEDLTGSVKNLGNIYGSTDTAMGSALDSLRSRLTNFIQDVSASGTDAGTNLVDGMTDGINDNADSTTTAVNNWTYAVIDQMLTDLDEHSPSRVSYDAGVNYVEGFNEGVTENAGTSQDSISQWGEQINEALSESVDALIENTQGKVEAIREAVDTLITNIDLLQGSLMNLTNAMSQVDDQSFSKVIGVIGTGMDTGTGSLYGSINSVINEISGESGLISKLSELDNTQLDDIINEFNGDSESLRSSIIDVANAIYLEDDDTCLVTRINNIVETIENIQKVTTAFKDLETQVKTCYTEVEELDNKIQNMQDKHVYIYTHHIDVDGEATGTAFTGGYATGTAYSGRSYASGSWGLPKDQPHSLVGEAGREIVVTPDGRYQVVSSPQFMNLKKGSIVFNHDQTEAILSKGSASNINRLAALGLKKIEQLNIGGRSFALGTAGGIDQQFAEAIRGYTGNDFYKQMSTSNRISDVTKNNNQRNIEVNFSGGIVLQGVQSVDGLAKAIVTQLPNKLKQELSK